jgi:mannan endo-1,4-beta-mannosidase
MTRSPVNPNASVPARRLLAFLYQLKGKGILSGQHDYLEAPDTYPGQIFKLTGKYPAVHGYELGAITGQSAADIARQRSSVVESAIRWHKAGGIVTMMFHARYPGTAPLWVNVQRATSEQEFARVVTPGTAEYNHLIRDIDEVADYLKRLRDAGVPVLWRPYHEMNGGWFWWGKKSRFVDLWTIMFDRYTRHHGLDNLLWVWNPNAPNAYADPFERYYPGHDKVDILAVDIYNNDYKQSHHDQLARLSAGKPIAIGENGEMPNPSSLQTSQPNWIWFMTWGKMLRENNSDAVIRNVYAHPYVLTRDKVNPAQFPLPEEPAEPAEPGKPEQPAEPAVPAKPEPSPANGLKGDYFAGVDFRELRLTRIDGPIRFDWADRSPAPQLPADHFSVRWTGAVVPEFDGEYTFYVLSDDGARLWVDGRLIIDKWVDQSRTEWSGKIRLRAGKPAPIRLEYYERTGNALVTLSWSHARRPKQVIPRSRLLTS